MLLRLVLGLSSRLMLLLISRLMVVVLLFRGLRVCRVLRGRVFVRMGGRRGVPFPMFTCLPRWVPFTCGGLCRECVVLGVLGSCCYVGCFVCLR